jgi:hypothetical protein
MSIIEFFEHFEGKDWLTAGLAAAAVAISIAAAIISRKANKLNELARPARFTAKWRAVQGREICVLELKNTGDAWADRLTVRMAADPYKLMGLTGTIREPVKPEQAAEFTLNQNSENFKLKYSQKPYGIVLHWHDTWGKARAQRIDPAEMTWGEPIDEYGKSDAHRPQDVTKESGLYDPLPWWSRLPGRPKWKLRRDNMPDLW